MRNSNKYTVSLVYKYYYIAAPNILYIKANTPNFCQCSDYDLFYKNIIDLVSLKPTTHACAHLNINRNTNVMNWIMLLDISKKTIKNYEFVKKSTYISVSDM